MLKSDAKVAATIIFAATINSAPTVCTLKIIQSGNLERVRLGRPATCFSGLQYMALGQISLSVKGQAGGTGGHGREG